MPQSKTNTIEFRLNSFTLIDWLYCYCGAGESPSLVMAWRSEKSIKIIITRSYNIKKQQTSSPTLTFEVNHLSHMG